MLEDPIIANLVEDIRRYVEEDLGSGDLTAGMVPPSLRAEARVITREPMVLCGQAWFNKVFELLDEALTVEWCLSDGDQVAGGVELCLLEGNAQSLLTGERTALNILQTLSATATLSRRFADAVAGIGVQILDTRKTLPGLRKAQKYAVKCGGCSNHRFGLFDGVLIKENHISAMGSINQAVLSARTLNPEKSIEVEVESLDELAQALDMGVERILLDNFTVAELRQAVVKNGGRSELEASGNINLESIREIAETGVDFISVGALTKNVRAVDLSMRIQFLH